MQAFRQLRNKTIQRTLILNLGLFVLSVSFYPPIAWGFLLGMCFGLIAFNWRTRALKQLETSGGKAAGKQFLSYLSRYLLYAIAFFLALQYNDLNAFSTVFGVVSVNFMLVFTSLTDKKALKH